MDLPHDARDDIAHETTPERAARLTAEAQMLAEARAEVEAGQTIALEEIRAWIDSIDTPQERPVPQPPR